MQQVSVLETNIGSSTTGNSANTQIIFNDAGTLRGDAQFTWNKTLNRLTVDGDEIISGDLTVAANTLKVDSLNDRVGIGTATPYALLHANGTIAAANFDWTPSFIAPTVGLLAASNSSSASIRIATLDSNPTHDPFVNFLTSGGQNWSIGIDNSDSDKFKIAFTNGFTGSNEVFAVDTSAVFSWYDGAGGTRMTLNATGLGVGEAASVSRLQPRGSTTDSSAYILYGKASSGNVICFMRNDGRFLVGNGTSDNFIVTETGNVGIGVTPSTAWNTGSNLQVGALGALYHNQTLGATDLTYNSIRTGTDTYQYLNVSSLQASRFQQRDGSFRWFNAAAGTSPNAIAFTQAMTLDASGNLGVGTTNPAAVFGTVRSGFVATGASGAIGAKVDATGRACLIAWNADTAGDNNFIQFFTEATLTSRGSVTYNRGSGQVAYNITSDYRLKEDIKPLTGAINRIASLKPSTYKLKETGFVCEGFIAHELAEVVPMAVTGAKDAVDSDGKPLYQAVDLSKIVPVLVAAIQELAAEVNALKNA
jgi:hypothetical protein